MGSHYREPRLRRSVAGMGHSGWPADAAPRHDPEKRNRFSEKIEFKQGDQSMIRVNPVGS
jgi:hypothetical protein